MDIGNYVELVGKLFEPAYVVDSNRTILFWNQPAEKITGYKSSMVIGKKCNSNIMMHINEKGEKMCRVQCPLGKAMIDGQTVESFSYLQHVKGHRIPIDTRFIPIRNGAGMMIGAIEFFVKRGSNGEDSKPSIIKELVKTAYVDSVTNLPNKEYMENKIKSLLLEAVERPSEVSLGLLSIEVQNLRSFNERGGMAVGNLLLNVVAKTLMGSVETEEGSFVCKWYGGSFVVFMNTNKISTLLNWANKLKILLEKSSVPEYEEERIKVGIGGIAAQAGESVAEVLKRLGEQLQLSKSQSAGISIL